MAKSLFACSVLKGKKWYLTHRTVEIKGYGESKALGRDNLHRMQSFLDCIVHILYLINAFAKTKVLSEWLLGGV